MTISEALAILDRCNFLKASNRHLHATRRKTSAEIWASHQPGHPLTERDFYHADVLIRRRTSETFEAFVVRAATLIQQGHVPKSRKRPALTSADRCACGSQSNLTWNEQLSQRLCDRCSRAWMTAARHNDMPIVKTQDQ